MVLYLRHDQVLAYESCSEVLKAEAQRAGGVELVKAGGLIDGEDESSVVDALAYYRKKIETGSTKRPRKEISSSSSAMESGILTKEEKMEKVRQARREAHKRNMARKTARQEKNQLRGHPAKK